MRCPKCGYNSFDSNQACPKCGRDLTSTREHLGFFPFTPQPVSYLEALLNQAENNFLFEAEEAESVDLGTYAENQEVEAGGLPAEEEGPAMSLEPEDQGISFTPEAEVGLSLEEESLTPDTAAPPEEGISLTLETEEGQGISLEAGPAESEFLAASEETVIIEPEEMPRWAEAPADQIEAAAPVQLGVEDEDLGLDLDLAAQEESVEISPEEQVLEFEDLDMAEAEEGVAIGVEAALSDEQVSLETPAEEITPEGALGVEETVMLEPEEIPGLEDIGATAVQEEEVSLETAVSEPERDEVFPPAMEEEGLDLDLSEEGLTEEAALDLSREEPPLDAESTLIIETDEEAEDSIQRYAQPPVVDSGPLEPRGEKTPDQEADSDLDLTDLDFGEEPQSVSLALDSEGQESLDLDLGDLELIEAEEEGNPDFETLDLEEKDK